MSQQKFTVFVCIEGGSGRLSGREEEEAAVNGDAGGDQRRELESVELPTKIGLLFLGHNDEEEDQDEDDEGLDSSSQRSQENGNENHGDLTEHHHAFPVVGVLLVALEEEPVSLRHLRVEEVILLFSQESPSQPGYPNHPK